MGTAIAVLSIDARFGMKAKELTSFILGVSGVTKADYHFTTGKMTVQYDPDILALKQIESAIDRFLGRASGPA